MTYFKKFSLIFFIILILSFFFAPSFFSQSTNSKTNSKTNGKVKRNVPFYLSDKQKNYVQKDLKRGSSDEIESSFRERAKEKGKGKGKGKKRKSILYKEPFVPPWGGFLINFFIPFGTGSYIQEDFASGFIQSAVDVTGLAFFLSAYFAFGDRGFSNSGTFFIEIFTQFESAPVQYALYMTALAAFISSWIAGIIVPWTFPKRRRTKYKRLLRRKRQKSRISSISNSLLQKIFNLQKQDHILKQQI